MIRSEVIQSIVQSGDTAIKQQEVGDDARAVGAMFTTRDASTSSRKKSFSSWMGLASASYTSVAHYNYTVTSQAKW